MSLTIHRVNIDSKTGRTRNDFSRPIFVDQPNRYACGIEFLRDLSRPIEIGQYQTVLTLHRHINQVTFSCHSRLFWYKILNTKNRAVCKIRKRLILTINKGFLYAYIYYYKRIDKHGKSIKFIVLCTEAL